MTEGGINQTWYAWTAGSLCASTQENALYFTYNDNRWSWFTTSKLYRFDIDTRTFTQIYDSATDKRYSTGQAYASIRSMTKFTGRSIWTT